MTFQDAKDRLAEIRDKVRALHDETDAICKAMPDAKEDPAWDDLPEWADESNTLLYEAWKALWAATTSSADL